ncbi:MAG: hypothetical protein WB554_14495, partial [Desulfomonilaceae bacterium]
VWLLQAMEMDQDLPRLADLIVQNCLDVDCVMISDQAPERFWLFRVLSAFIMNQGCYIGGKIISHLQRIVFCQTVKNSLEDRLRPPAK